MTKEMQISGYAIPSQMRYHQRMIDQINYKYRALRKKKAPKEALRNAITQRKRHERWLKLASEKFADSILSQL